MKIASTVLMLGALAAPPLVHAGSPGGLELLSLATSKAAPYAPVVAGYFKRVGREAAASDCENGMVNVDKVQYQSPKKAITSQLVLEAVFSKARRQQLGMMLSKVRTQDVERGFDGALVYDVIGNDVVFYGVSAEPSEKVRTARVPVAEIGQPARVDAALCHIMVNLPVLQAP